METATMMRDTVLASPADWSRPDSSVSRYPRRKPRLRSSEDVGSAIDANPAGDEEEREPILAAKQLARECAEGPIQQDAAEPASSTTPRSGDDADPETDSASVKECAQKGCGAPEKPEVSEGVHSGHTSSPYAIAPVAEKAVYERESRYVWYKYIDESSDDDEDYRVNYKQFLRLRDPEEDGKEEELIAEIKKKRSTGGRRLKREEESLKKKKKVPTSALFFCLQAQKAASLLLEPVQIDEDLVQMFGVERGHFDDPVDATKDAADKGVKRKRPADQPDADVGDAKRQQVLPKLAKTSAGKSVATRSNLAACKKVGNGKAGGPKKKVAGSNIPGGKLGKQFTKHPDKKGWVICNPCQTEVWPPNMNKHAAACKAKSS